MDGTVLVWTAASPQQADLWRGYLRVLNARGQEIPCLRVTLEPDAAQ